MQRVRIQVPRLRCYGADTGFQVYGDGGTGTIDYAHPLTPQVVALWPEAERRAGHLSDGHLMIRHLDGMDPDGHLEGTHLSDNHLTPAGEIHFDTPAYVFGRFRHGVRMVDGAGNESAATETVVSVNGAPTAPACVERAGYDALGDVVAFTFTAGRFGN